MVACAYTLAGLDLPAPVNAPSLQSVPHQDFAIWVLPESNIEHSVSHLQGNCTLGRCHAAISFVDDEQIWISRRSRTPPNSA
jgi:hypothetical protein